MADQTVTARLRVEADTSGAARLVNGLTGQVINLAKAEKQASEAVRQRGAAYKQVETYRLKDEWGGRNDTYGFAKPGAAFDQPAAKVPAWVQARLDAEAAEQRRRQDLQAAHDRLWRQAEDRRRVFDGGNPAPGSTADFDLTARQRAGRYQQQEQLRREMHNRGLNLDGSPRTAGDRAAELMGEQRGLIGVATGISTALPQVAAHYSRLQTNPYTSSRWRAEELANSVPLYGSVFSTGTAIGRGITGENRRIGEQTRQNDLAMLRQERMAALNERLNVLGRSEGEAQRLQEAFGVAGAVPNYRHGPVLPDRGRFAGVAFAGPRIDAGIDRSTAAGQRQYDEARRLLPIQRELALLERQRSAAAMSVGDSMQRERRLAQDIEAIGRQREEAARRVAEASIAGGRTGAAGGAKAAEQQAVNALAQLDKQRAELQQRREQELEVTLAAKMKVAGIDSQSRRVEAQFARERLSIAEGREQQATAGAANLARAGVGGRALGKVGLDLIRKHGGTDYVPRELVEAARQLDPEGVEKAEQASGEKFKGDVRKHALDPNSPYLQDVAEARRRVNEAREKVARKEDTADVQDAVGMTEAFRGQGERLAEIVKKALKAQEEAFENKMLQGTVGNPG